MRFLHKNELEGSVITSDFGSTNYPESNIFHPFLRRKWQSRLPTDTLRCTLPLVSGVSVDSFFLSFHNLSKLTIRCYGGGMTLLCTDVYFPTTRALSAYRDRVDGVTYVEIDVETDNQYARIGAIGIGLSTAIGTRIFDYSPVQANESSIDRTLAGQVSRVKGETLQVRSGTVRGLSRGEMLNGKAKLDSVGPGKPIFIDLFPGQPEFTPPMWATFEDYEYSPDRGGDFNFRFTIQEAR